MTDSYAQVVVVGSHAPGIFVRVKNVPKAGETVIGWDFHEPKDGGKGSNQAIAAARLGAKVCFVGCVGMDRVGDDGEKWMREAGVDTTWLQRHATVSSGIGFILLDESGVPAMVTSMGANAELSQNYIQQVLDQMKGARVLLTQFEIPPEVAIFAARLAKQLGMIAIINPAPAPEGFLEGLDGGTILVPNETEAKSLLGIGVDAICEPVEMALDLCKRAALECVLITLGEQGIVGATRCGETWSMVPPKVDVVDTSGAGDAFCAALAVGLANGMSIRSASEWACISATLSVTRPGTIPAYPTREEVEAFRQSLIVK
jgi:ribokinase